MENNIVYSWSRSALIAAAGEHEAGARTQNLKRLHHVPEEEPTAGPGRGELS